jgi:HEAT repeat protein
LLREGGALRLYVAPSLGCGLVRVEHADRFGMAQRSFEAAAFRKVAPGVYFPMKYRIVRGPEPYATYDLYTVDLVNEPMPKVGFPFSLLPGPAPSTTAPATVEGETASALESLCYDGKSFADWKRQLGTELKPERQAEAIQALAAFAVHGYGSEAASAIIEMMRRYDVWTHHSREDFLARQAALNAFGKGSDPQFRAIDPALSVPLLAAELEKGNRNGRLLAVSALKEIGAAAQAALPALTKTVVGDEDPQVRRGAREAMAVVDQTGETIASALEQMIGHEEPEVVMDFLSSLLVRHRASMPLLRHPKTWQFAPRARPVLKVVIGAIGHEQAAIRQGAMYAVRAVGPDAKEAVPALIRAFEKGDLDERVWSAQALAAIGPAATQAIPVFVEALKDQQKPVRQEVIEALGALGPAAKDAVGPLIEAFRDADHNERMVITDAFQRIGPAAKDAVGPLIEAFRNADHNERRRIADAFRRIGPAAKEAVPLLMAAARVEGPDQDPDLRRAALRAVTEITRKQ